MLLTYDPSKDLAYIELTDDWKGAGGGSNFANIPVEEGVSVEVTVFFSEGDHVHALRIKNASRWLAPDVLRQAAPFVRCGT
jgi:uncharacterized protein YuzE